MKRLFLIFGLVLVSTMSFSQTVSDTVSYDPMNIPTESGKNTLIAGLVANSVGCILAIGTEYWYVNKMNSLGSDTFQKEAKTNLYKTCMKVSIGFIGVGLVLDIVGINQISNRIKYEDGKLTYKF